MIATSSCSRPTALRAFYALPERDASKGLADYRMLVRKLPEELFAGVRTLAHDLFGAQDVETYLGHLDHALDLELAELGHAGIDRRVRVRPAGRPPPRPGVLDRRSRGRAAVVRPAGRRARPARRGRRVRASGHGCARWRRPTRQAERAALARFEIAVGELLTLAGTTRAESAGFLDEIAGRWSDAEEPARTQGIARDVVLLHVATMTNLFAALGWTLAQLALDPPLLARVAAGDDALLERCALESTRIGQCSVMSRTVMTEIEFDDGAATLPGLTRRHHRDDARAHQHERRARPRPLRPRPLGRPPPARRSVAPDRARR